jgi:hypothetical protein
MDRLSAPEQNAIGAYFADLLRKAEMDSGPEFLPRGLDVMGLVRQLALPSAETVEKLSYGDPLFRMPTQSNIPITTDRGYVAEVLGMAPAVPPAARATTRISNEVADQLVKAITRNPDATAVRALDEISRMSPVPQITTYHGSPHLFGRLDPSKVGTGEGAQAYGVGAGYTAEARPVAEEYKRFVQADKSGGFPSFLARSRYAESGGDKEKAAASINESISRLENDRNFLRNAMDVDETIKSYQDALKVLEDIQSNQGYLYKGEIPDEILPKFLDWDKPISNQKEVQQILESENLQDLLTRNEPRKVGRFTQVRIGGEPSGAEITGADLYRNLTEKLGSEKIASDYLESIGIRGIRYLDQGSRGSGEGTSNFIPFSPEDFRIQEINDIPIEDYYARGLLEPEAAKSSFKVVQPGDQVSGLTVREEVPNMGSISATLDDYEVLSGIREVPRGAFDKEYLDSLSFEKLDKRTKDLANQINESKEINPMIVGVDSKGAYIIEGGHRFDALMAQDTKSIPAMVVIDKSDPPTEDVLRGLLSE